MDNLVEMCW